MEIGAKLTNVRNARNLSVPGGVSVWLAAAHFVRDPGEEREDAAPTQMRTLAMTRVPLQLVRPIRRQHRASQKRHLVYSLVAQKATGNLS